MLTFLSPWIDRYIPLMVGRVAPDAEDEFADTGN
jgi:hypothetical protein